MYMPNSRWTWAFMSVALLQAIISLALEAYVFGEFQATLLPPARKHNAPTATRTIPTYLALFIFGFIYELILVYDALRAKNQIQVIGLCIYNLGMLIYASVEMNQVAEAVELLQNDPHGDFIHPETWPKLKPFLLAAPCVIALGTALLSFIAWKLYDEFAWTIYKHISADLRLKRRYLVYQIYIALLKFDFFFFLGFTVQFIVVVSQTDSEFRLTIAAIPITVALLFLAAYITRRESYVGQCGIMVVYFAAMAYFFFKLVRMYDSPRAYAYAPIRRSLTTFAVLTILLLVVTIITGFMCMNNFNKGLKPHIQRRKIADAGSGNYAHGVGVDPYAAHDTEGGRTAHPLQQVPERMTID